MENETSNLERLVNNLELIKAEVSTKLKPENIRSGVTILGVTGTYAGEEVSNE